MAENTRGTTGTPGTPEQIRWQDNRWVCDPFIVELFQVSGDERVPVSIDPKTVRIADTRDWLEKDGDPVRGADKKWRIPVRIRQEKLRELAPEGYTEISWKPPLFVIGDLPVREEAPPQKALTTTLRVSVAIVSPAEVATGAALEAAGGMLSGTGKAVAATLPKPRVESHPVAYDVVPPVPRWTMEQKTALLLSGTGTEETATLTLERLPEGWDTGLTVTIALPEEAAKNMGITIRAFTDAVPDAARGLPGISGGSLSLGGTPLVHGAEKPDSISAKVTLASFRLCMKPVKKIAEKPVPVPFPLPVSTKSAFLGSIFQWAPAAIAPVEVCICFGNEPAAWYFSADEKRHVRVIRNGTGPGHVPRRSALAVTLGSTKDAGISPAIRWERKERSMDDAFSPETGEKTMYRAPGQASWERAGAPSAILCSCLVGPEEEATVIKDAPVEMFSTALLEAPIALKQPLGFAKIRVTLSPSGLPAAGRMALFEPAVLEQFHREFCVLADLQEIADKKGGD